LARTVPVVVQENHVFPEEMARPPRLEFETLSLGDAPPAGLWLFGVLFGAPVDEVAGVEGDAEKIGGDETELGGAHADDTDDSAIEGGNDPALPELFANEDGGENGQDAGQTRASPLLKTFCIGEEWSVGQGSATRRRRKQGFLTNTHKYGKFTHRH
jgi:hypothetical protein